MCGPHVVAATAAVLLLGVVATADEPVDNPEYANWAKFQKGTTVTVRTTTVTTAGEQTGNTSEILTTAKLLSVDANKVVVEVGSMSSGTGRPSFGVLPKPRDIPRRLALPVGVSKSDFETRLPGTIDEGTEVLRFDRVEYKSRWYKTRTTTAQGNKIEAKTWISDEVPGRVLKEKSSVSGPRMSWDTTRELIDWKKP